MFSAAAECSPQVIKCKILLGVGSAIVHEYLSNKEFYNDFIRFNCANRTSAELPSELVTFGNPPAEALRVIDQVYARFRNLSKDEIFKILGVQKKNFNRTTPVEYKWYLVYTSKYGKIWNKANIVSVAEILA
jgi:hypothetical protein